uniref:G-protein coupled receptors family 1 profile domain-containing protein n=1 Tax=Ciona savignyi TaxID=51511 RepID=H2YR13_CIOSA
MVLFTWVWSNLLSMPTFLGWGRIAYDQKMMVCSWDDTFNQSFTIFITVGAIVIPIIVIAFCYLKLFLTVRGSGRWVRSLSMGSGVFQSNEQHRRSIRKERNLLQTLATTVAFFCVCWVPYGLSILIDAKGVPKHAKKVFGWLGLSNSMVNFIIYGAMNPVFRRGYRNLFILVFRCKRESRITSTAMHGSHSDNMYRSNRKKSLTGTPIQQSRTNNANAVLHADRASPNPIIHTAKQNSAVEMNQAIDPSRRRHSHLNNIWSTNVTPWNKFLDSKTETPRHQSKSESPVHKSTQQLTKTDRTYKSPIRLLSFKRSGSGRRVENVRNESALREGRKKRNSLMLLQIELSDDESPLKRRTKSEIPYGVQRPVVKLNSSSSVGRNAVLPHIDNRDDLLEKKSENNPIEEKLEEKSRIIQALDETNDIITNINATS